MWSYENLFPDLMMWLLVAACLIWAMVQIYETFFRFRTRAGANRGAVNNLLGRSELCLHVPSHIAHAARGRIVRIQLSLLDREFDNLGNATLTELHPSTATPSMTEEDINVMPIQKYNTNSPESASSSSPEASSSLSSREESINVDMNKEAEDESVCNICLEQVHTGDLVCRLPCLHQFHAHCIEQWLKKHAICPVCKALMCLKIQAIKESGETAATAPPAAATPATVADGGGADMV